MTSKDESFAQKGMMNLATVLDPADKGTYRLWSRVGLGWVQWGGGGGGFCVNSQAFKGRLVGSGSLKCQAEVRHGENSGMFTRMERVEQ